MVFFLTLLLHKINACVLAPISTINSDEALVKTKNALSSEKLKQAVQHPANQLTFVREETKPGPVHVITAHRFTHVYQHMSVITIEMWQHGAGPKEGTCKGAGRRESRRRARAEAGTTTLHSTSDSDSSYVHFTSRSASILPAWMPLGFVVNLLLFWLPFTDGGTNTAYIAQLLHPRRATPASAHLLGGDHNWIHSEGFPPGAPTASSFFQRNPETFSAASAQARFRPSEASLDEEHYEYDSGGFFFSFVVGPVLLAALFVAVILGERYGYPRLYRRVCEILRNDEIGRSLPGESRRAVEVAVKEALRAPNNAVKSVSQYEQFSTALEQVNKVLQANPKAMSGLSALGGALWGRTNTGKVVDLVSKIAKKAAEDAKKSKK